MGKDINSIKNRVFFFRLLQLVRGFLYWKHKKIKGCLWLTCGLIIPAAARYTDNLQPDLLGRFPADVCPDISHRAKFGHSLGEGGGGG